jgi:parvulin-like peptidyl-prolyl isomerase
VKRLACALVLVLAAAFATACGSSTSPATVNGVAIDRGEFLDQLSQLAKLQGGTDTSVTTEQSSSLLTQRIISALISDEVKRLGLTVTDDNLATARTEIGDIPEGISQAFADYVIRIQAQQDVLIARVTDTTQPWFTDTDVNNFYGFVKDTKYTNYCTHHILVDAEADANEIMGLLKNGGDFAQLAKDRSTDTQSSADGGDLGCTSKGSFVPEFEDAVLGAKTGDTLGPVKTTYGYHIIRVDKAYGLQPLDDTLRASIATTLNNEQGWLSWKAYSSKISVNKKYGSWSNDQISVIPPADPTVK